jgi:hypothetical protein
MASMTASRLSAGLSDGSRQDDAGRPAGPQPQISPLSVDPAFVASTASSSSSWDGQSSEVAQRPYSAVSPVASPSQEEAAAFGQPASTLPFERPTPPQQSPNPPVAAYLSQSSAEAEPKGYTPLNDMSVSARAALKGKGRAQNQGWVDLERGGEAGSLVDDEEHDMVKDGWDRVEGTETVRSPPTSDLAEYPPPLAMTEEEREEKRIADVRSPSLPCRGARLPHSTLCLRVADHTTTNDKLVTQSHRSRYRIWRECTKRRLPAGERPASQSTSKATARAPGRAHCPSRAAHPPLADAIAGASLAALMRATSVPSRLLADSWENDGLTTSCFSALAFGRPPAAIVHWIAPADGLPSSFPDLVHLRLVLLARCSAGPA